MFNNNNDCIYKALSNTVLFEDKKDQQKQPSSNNHKNQEKQNWLWKAPHSRPAAGQAGKEEETAPNSFSSGFRNLYKASVLRSESTGRNIEVQKRDMKPFKAL